MRLAGKLILVTFSLTALPTVAACDPLAVVQASHVQANAPDQRDFDRLLQRDLDAYFSASGVPNAKAEFDLLRQGPTQSGVSYPKYYLWVRAYADGELEAEGAVRVAAVERSHFEVTDFLSRADIIADPDSAASVFPAAIVPAIHERAGAD